MNKTKKLLNLLAGLGEDITIRDVSQVRIKSHRTRIDITINHKSHKRLCPHCGSSSCRKHGKEPSWVFHIPQGERCSSRLLFSRQRFKCSVCGGTFFEDPDWIYRNSHLSAPLARCIEEDLHHFIPKKDIARVNGVSPYFVSLVASRLVPDVPAHLPSVICLDEKHSEVFEAKNTGSCRVNFTTNFSNGETGELLDILPFRTIRKMEKYFKKHYSYKERCRVKHLCCDMAGCYTGLVRKCFPNADVCVDNYHVVNRLNRCVNDIRVREQNRLTAANEKKSASDLKHLSHKFVTSIYRQKYYWGENCGKYMARMEQHFSECPELKDAYAMLQYFHEIFHEYFPFDEKVKQLDLWISVFEKSTSPDIASAVKSVRKHLSYIHNAWKHGYSNATCEGNNNGIQAIKNLSFGIHSFRYFRTRALLILGRPGVSRAYKKMLRDAEETTNPSFFDDFPSLDEYVLSYDWKHPRTDMSKKGA